jgi:hypothetical protein
MEGLLAAEPAILVELQTIGIVLLVLESIVIPLLALGAGQRDLNAHGISPSPGIPSKTSPLWGHLAYITTGERFCQSKSFDFFGFFGVSPPLATDLKHTTFFVAAQGQDSRFVHGKYAFIWPLRCMLFLSNPRSDPNARA